jgi:hypothetical protein
MVLPGIQTLFGFQLIVVFNPGFDQKLSATEQQLHLIAIVLVATAVAIIMTPAAYNRQTTPMEVTEDFVRVSTRLLLWSMFPLAVGISLDLYLIGRVIAGSIGGGVLSAGVFAVYVILWFLLPRVRIDSSAHTLFVDLLPGWKAGCQNCQCHRKASHLGNGEEPREPGRSGGKATVSVC